jgi:hypothetical protein
VRYIKFSVRETLCEDGRWIEEAQDGVECSDSDIRK